MNTTKQQPNPLQYQSRLRAFRFFAAAAIAASAWQAAQGQITLPFYEAFPTSYGDGTSLGSGASASTWAFGNSVGSNGLTNRSSAALSYPGLATGTGLGVVIPPAGSSGRDQGLSFNSGTFGAGNPTLYVSFLLNIQTSPTSVRNLVGLRNSTGSGTPHVGLFVTTTNTLMISKNNTTPAAGFSAALTANTTHLVVLRYRWVSTASGDDEVAMWLDPGSLGAPEGSVPAVTLSSVSGSDVTSLLGLRLKEQSGDTGVYWVDELRIGSTWAAVTPTGCAPPTAYALTGGGAYCSGGSGASVGLANSDLGINYQLRLNGTDTGSPLAGTGAALDFGLQMLAGSYTVRGSNTATACIGLMTGNAAVSINTAPSISAGASNTVVCSGSTGNFTVTATGSSLTYQWQSDSGTGFGDVTSGTGATSSSYTTAALLPTDNGTQYRCIVSGVCSPSAISGIGIVTVSSGASINSGPADKTVSVGSIVTLSVSATGPALAYQWQVSIDGGVTYNNVSTGTGGTSASYTTAPLALTDSGNKYQCIVSAACGLPATAGPATVTVNAAIYRTAASGAWHAVDTWEQSYNGGGSWVPGTTSPTADNTTNITVLAGHTISVTNALLVDDLVIQAGGELDASGATITINDNPSAAVDCDVFGTLTVANVANSSVAVSAGAGVVFENGGHYIWNGPSTTIFPVATWADGSICENQGGTTSTPIGLGQSFYNFYWNRTASGAVSLSNLLTTVRHELRMHGSSSASASVRFLSTTAVNDLHVGGDVVIEGGFVTSSGNSTPNTTLNLTMGGNLVINPGANLDSRNSGAGSANNFIFTNTSNLQFITNSGVLGHSGDGGGTPNNWIVSNGVAVVLASGNLTLGTANNLTRDSISVDGALNLGLNQITGPGDLRIGAGGILAGNGTNQITAGLATTSYGGTLNLGTLPPLNSGDSFKIFDATSYSGAFTSILPSPGGGLVWDTTQLAINGTLAVTIPNSGPDTTPTNLIATISADLLTLSWPSNHIGWTLQVQTNSLDTNWSAVSGSAVTNQVTVPIDRSLSEVFYRLSYP